MNKLIVALMAAAFAGSVMAADMPKGDAGAAAATEKPAAAPKKAAHKKHVKKAKKAAPKMDEGKSDAAPAK